MTWWVKSTEISDGQGNGTGRWCLTATSDAGSGGPYRDETHDHATREEARECQRCHDHCAGITGIPIKEK